MIIYLKDTMDDLQTFVVTGTTEISNSASTQNMVFRPNNIGPYEMPRN